MILESHIDGHHHDFVNLTEADTHVNHQLPNDRTRTTQFLNSINSMDPELIAAIAAIKRDNIWMRDNFEETIAFLTPCDPVARKRSTSKRPSAEISVATADRGSLKDRKIGRTGVEICWYKYREFNALNEAKKEELQNRSATQPKKGAKKNCPGKAHANQGVKQGENQ